MKDYWKENANTWYLEPPQYWTDPGHTQDQKPVSGTKNRVDNSLESKSMS